eukprot:994856_1
MRQHQRYRIDCACAWCKDPPSVRVLHWVSQSFFDDLSEIDMVQEDIWKQFSQEFEVMAFNEMSRIESNHLLFVILNIPLTQHDGKSLLELALDEKRISFLNNDR